MFLNILFFYPIHRLIEQIIDRLIDSKNNCQLQLYTCAPPTLGPSRTDIIISTLQALVSSINTIQACQQLRNSSIPSTSTTIAATQDFKRLTLGMASQPSTSTQIEAAQHSLASAVPDLSLSRQYISQAANILARLWLKQHKTSVCNIKQYLQCLQQQIHS